MAQALRERLLYSDGDLEYVISATGCCYTSIVDPRVKGNVLIGCKGENELGCLKKKYCIVANERPMGVAFSFTPDAIKHNRGGTVLALSLYFFELELKMPTTLYHGTNSAFCFRYMAALPFTEPVPEPVCAICCVRFLPGPMGILAPPTSGKPVFPFAQLMER